MLHLDLTYGMYVGNGEMVTLVLVLRPSVENHSTDLLLPSGSS